MPDGDMSPLLGLDRSLPTTRSSNVKEFSTACESDESEFNRRGAPRSFLCRFHSCRRSGEISDLLLTCPLVGDDTVMGLSIEGAAGDDGVDGGVAEWIEACCGER